MLATRDTDIQALFLVFVVVPLVTYFILGKWSEATKRKERISLIAKRAAEEALRVEDMAVGSVIPMASVPNDGFHQCARCFGTATTRCSQCKSVWYCSGRCQITHWRQVHKLECQQLVNSCQILSPKPISREGSHLRVSYDESMDPNLFEYNVMQQTLAKTSSNDVISNPLTIYDTTSGMTMDTSGKHVTRNPYGCLNGDIAREITLQESIIVERQSVNGSDNVYRDGNLNSSTMAINGAYACNGQTNLLNGENLPEKGSTYYDETKGLNFSPGKISMKRINKTRTATHSHGVKPQKSPKLGVKTPKDNAEESSAATTKDNIPLQESNRISSHGVARMVGLMKSTKLDHQQHSEDGAKKLKKLKMLFPYEEFVKCFQFEVLNVSPRGLVNCGNSCYANAVLQCLTFTKPLIIYLLRQSHSRAGCAKNWCLMCELERHVMMLRESRCPLSPGNILMHIRSLNSQIGDGSQEDAHEFLRLIVTSMQSICLECLGGENVVDLRLQDTTFVQHTFGGRLRSKVKCLRCLHESERNENIMDLTLEIFGWVESLQDALTQFTSSEDLDGENMYRCGRCASYVQARKQLSIQEAPNILTIVLKRFQEGNYGKINKCITFPEMLDMIPFMTGKDDMPPLYMLYAVVVHLDTSNASFSGHYISYVKDLRGNWFKIDDTEVQPVELSQVMSQGAYILFYARSHPRPARGYSRKATHHRSPDLPKHYASKTEKSSKLEQSKLNQSFIGREPFLDCRLDTNIDYTDNSRGILVRESRIKPPITKNYAEFSDATSSDWSLFTSSDDASFTTESTRDSFSAVDYADAVPFSSIFQSLYPTESSSRRTISCSVFPSSMPQTRFAQEEKGFVSVSCIQSTPPSSDWGRDSIRQASVHPTIGFYNDYSNGTMHLNYGSDPRNESPFQTYDHC